jgi:hypothetical protein
VSRTFLDAFDDPGFFGPYFAGPSWDTWRAVLKAAHGASLTDTELALFRSVADRDPPKRRVRELWVVAGRRSGKDSVASAMATYSALQPYSGLRPGETPAIMCLANDRTQARVVLRYVRGLFEAVEGLHGIVERETPESLELSNGVEISIMTNSLRAVRGRTVAFACLDECAFYRSDDCANPDVETFNALRPGMATIPDAMLVGISSPYKKSGLLYSRWKDYYGRDDDGILVVRAASQVLNPTLDQAIVDEAMERDAASAKAEYFAEWRDDISGFIDADLIESCIERGLERRPPQSGVSYKAFVDISGGRSDSAVIAVGHLGRDRIVLDLIGERKAPFSPESVVGEFASILRSFGLGSVTGDDYAAEFRNERFSAHGVRYELSELNRSEIYLNCLPALTSGQVDLLDNRRMVAQFAQLERRTSRAGRDTIDHPQHGHDDISNSVAGVIVLLATKKQMPNWNKIADAFERPYATPLDSLADRLSEPVKSSPWDAPRDTLNVTLGPSGTYSF